MFKSKCITTVFIIIFIYFRPPFGDSVYATHCLLDTKNVSDLSPYIPLAKQGIYCISTLYINEVLQRSAKDIRDCILPYFREFYVDHD